MSTFNGLDLVLLLALLTALYAIYYLWGSVQRSYTKGWFDGHQHASSRFVRGWVDGYTKGRKPATRLYDHEKDGL